MMSLLKFVIAYLIPLVSGYFIASWFLRERACFIEKIILGFGLGLGAVSIGLFILGIAGIPFSTMAASLALFVITLPFIVACALTTVRGRVRYSFVLPSDYRPSIYGTAFMALMVIFISAKLIFVFYEGFNRPIVSHDAWWNWSSGAKVFFYNKGLILDTADEHFFGRGYRSFLGYPLLNPLSQVWVSLVYGDFHESMGKAWVSVLFGGTLGLVYFTMRREAGRLRSFIPVFLLSASPLLTYHALDAYADLPLAFYVLSGSVLLWRYLEEGDIRTLSLSGLMFSIGAFTKNEGVVYLAAAGTALLIHSIAGKKLGWRGLFWFFLSASVYLAPWIIFKGYYDIGYGHGAGTGVGIGDETGAFTWTERIHTEVIGIFLKELFFTVNHALIFPFLAVLSVICFKTIVWSNIKYLYMILFSIVAVLLLAYTLTPDYQYVINRAASNRNILTFLPLSFLVAGLTVAKALHSNDG